MIVLDIFIGLVLVYFLYSLLVSIIAEMLSTWMGMRARLLRQGIENLLNDQLNKSQMFDFWKWLKDIFLVESENFIHTNAGKFYKEPSIKYLAKVGEHRLYSVRNTKPAYIHPENFVATILNMLVNKGIGINEWEKVKFAIEKNTLNLDPETHKMFKKWLSQANDSYQNFKIEMQHSFNETMDRVNGWYKRKISLIIFWIGFIVCFVINTDTFQIVKVLRDNPEARNTSIELATRIVNNPPIIKKGGTLPKDSVAFDSLKKELKAHLELVNKQNQVLGLGWDDMPSDFKSQICFFWDKANPFTANFWGIVITALALSLGAQFWFDLLKKLIAIRGAGIKPEANDADIKMQVEPQNTSDGLAITEQNPAKIAIAQNLKAWEEIKGFAAANAKVDANNNPAIEVVFEQNTIPASFPTLLQVTTNGMVQNINIIPIVGSKASLGLGPIDSLNQTATNAWGTAAGMVFNSRTKSTSILTCGHVVRSNSAGYIDLDNSKIHVNTNHGLVHIGNVSNTVMSVFCDAGLIDITKANEPQMNNIPQIQKFRKVSDSEVGQTEVSINKIGTITKAKIISTSFYYTFTDHGNPDVRYFDLIVLANLNSIMGPLSMPGDSGSLVVSNHDACPIGILVGASIINNQHISFAIKLSDIFDIMQIETL